MNPPSEGSISTQLPNLIFDAHLDLSMNALEWNRDLRQSIRAIRDREEGRRDKPDRGKGTVCFPEMRRGGIGLCVATQIARYVEPGHPRPGWHSPQQAWAQTQGQLAWYQAMEEAGELVLIQDAAQLRRQRDRWKAYLAHLPKPNEMDPMDLHHAVISEDAGTAGPAASPLPIGYVLALEGADSILSSRHLERAFEAGLRAIGLSHYGPGIYSAGTEAEGGLTSKGRALLAEIDRLGMILDVTHLTDDAFWEVLDLFDGPIWASHCNCRSLVPHQRQLNDDQISKLIERGAVIGAVFDAWMLEPDWIRGTTTPQSVNLMMDRVLDHTDHICQLAGNSAHCMIGSDLDGGYGREQCPQDLDTIADLRRIPDQLSQRGYGKSDIERICSGNCIAFLLKAWG